MKPGLIPNLGAKQYMRVGKMAHVTAYSLFVHSDIILCVSGNSLRVLKQKATFNFYHDISPLH